MSAASINKLTSVLHLIINSISQMSAAITDKIGITNNKLDQVKAEIASPKAQATPKIQLKPIPPMLLMHKVKLLKMQ